MASPTASRIAFGHNAWLIAYDIADPLRLARIHRRIKRQGIPLQYSLFIAWLDRREVTRLAAELRGMMDEQHDDIRFYALPKQANVNMLGQQWLPTGVELYADGSRLFGTLDTNHHAIASATFPEPDSGG